jgi:hypothetical protein
MIRLSAILPLLFLSSAVLGKTFECSDLIADAFSTLAGEEAPVLVVATVNADGGTGTIEVADEKFEAKYQVEGLDRTWRFFTADGQEFGYLFLIQPDGVAAYFDHETSKGELTYSGEDYSCHERKTDVSAPEITEAERKRQVEIGRQREENKRLRRELEDVAQADEIAAEENRFSALDAGALAIYVAQIKQKIERNWSAPASARAEVKCSARVRQVPGGEVVGVTILNCNGDDAVKRSLEAAIYRSSPLPEPSDPNLFDRNILLNLSIRQ